MDMNSFQFRFIYIGINHKATQGTVNSKIKTPHYSEENPKKQTILFGQLPDNNEKLPFKRKNPRAEPTQLPCTYPVPRPVECLVIAGYLTCWGLQSEQWSLKKYSVVWKKSKKKNSNVLIDLTESIKPHTSSGAAWIWKCIVHVFEGHLVDPQFLNSNYRETMTKKCTNINCYL